MYRIAAAVLLTCVATCLPSPAHSACDTTCGLADHNREVLLEYILNNNTAPLDDAALTSFFAVTPAGIESREQVLATNVNLDVTSVSRARVLV